MANHAASTPPTWAGLPPGSGFIEHLAHHARVQPNAIAVRAPGGQRLTYADELELVQRFAARLRAGGAVAGDVVLISLSNPLLDGVVTLACLHQGLVSCSTDHADAPPPAIQPRLMVTDRALNWGAELPCIRVHQAFMGDLLQDRLPELSAHCWNPDAVARLILSSGTTGVPKGIAMTHAQLLRRALEPIGTMQVRGHPTLNTMRLSSSSGFRQMLSATIYGETMLHANTPEEALETILEYGVVRLTASPIQLRALSARMQARGVRAPTLRETWVTGGLFGAADAQRWRELAPGLERLCRLYGSTEVGAVALWDDAEQASDASSLGWLVPEVQVRILGPEGQELPRGQVGRIALRGPALAQGYWNDPQRQREHFQDGWFVSSDHGQLTAQGELLLQGRSEEVINVGGVKSNPDALDQRVLPFAGLQDAATFRMQRADGSDAVGLAVVLSAAELDHQAFHQHLLKQFGVALFPAHVWRVEAIPRNPMGKVSRQQLAQRLLERVTV